MSTTTIRLPEELKARIAKVAERAGTSQHSFILEAIAEKTEQAERRADFHAEAEQRWAEFLETGESITWEEARRYFQAGSQARKPSTCFRASWKSEVTCIRLGGGVMAELDRIADYLRHHESEHADTRANEIISALDVLAGSPLIAPPVHQDKPELVIGRGSQGYVALYPHVAVTDIVVVPAIGAQREGGYARDA